MPLLTVSITYDIHKVNMKKLILKLIFQILVLIGFAAALAAMINLLLNGGI